MEQHPVLLLHGALGSPEQLQPLAHVLKDHNQVYTLRFRGHGGDLYDGPLNMDGFVEDIAKFQEDNQIKVCHIFGYSMGGYAALLFAAKYPHRVSKICTLGTKFDWNPESAEKEAGMLNPDVMEIKIPAFTTVLQQRFFPVDWKDAVRRTAAMMVNLGKNPGLTRESLQNIFHDIIISVGSLDTMVSGTFSEEIADLLPNGQYKEWEGWPHPIEKANVKILAEQLTGFFR
jgi:pimeloyl-ACP methyl ester carboxylesterase